MACRVVPSKRIPLAVVVALITAIYATSIYANCSFFVKNSADYRFFPPFERGVNANENGHLGGEYFNMARSLLAGEGFAHPFDRRTGPTAWQPPVLPVILAGLLWGCGGSRDGVMVVVVMLQVFVLIGTGLLVMALARQTTTRVGTGVSATLFFVSLLCEFRLCFQATHDYWLVLLVLDLLIAGLCWFSPLGGRARAAAWGLFGGLSAQINPVVGFTWVLSSLLVGIRERAWSRLGIAGLIAGLTLTPWTVRNYLVFGRLIPTKSNLGYELYQSQCLQPDGLLQGSTFPLHPYAATTLERQEYNALGEAAFVARKWEQFRQAVGANPQNFLQRVAHRFLGATVWYEPFDRATKARRPWTLWLGRTTHPLPFVSLLVLVFSTHWRRLDWVQWTVIGVYCLYLLPYVGASYYERYACPLLGVKVLLLIWAADRLMAMSRRPGPLRSRESGMPTPQPDRKKDSSLLPVSWKTAT